jgi:hypothetical protein
MSFFFSESSPSAHCSSSLIRLPIGVKPPTHTSPGSLWYLYRTTNITCTARCCETCCRLSASVLYTPFGDDCFNMTSVTHFYHAALELGVKDTVVVGISRVTIVTAHQPTTQLIFIRTCFKMRMVLNTKTISLINVQVTVIPVIVIFSALALLFS